MNRPLAHHVLFVCRALVALGLAAAVIGKLFNARETGLMIAKRLLEVYQLQVPPFAALSAVVLLDLGLLGLVLTRPTRVNPAIALAGSGLLFLIHHAASWWLGVDGDCGCFGVGGSGSALSVLLASLMVTAGALAAIHLPTSPFARPGLLAASLCLLVPLASAPLVSTPLRTLVERLDRPTDEIRARDKTLFVFSSRCESCLNAARRLKGPIERGEIVGITTTQHGSIDDFFSRMTFRFPVETVTPTKWFSLLDDVPPRYLYIDGGGKISPLPTAPH